MQFHTAISDLNIKIEPSKKRTMISTLLVEDHSIVRNGIRLLLEKEPDLDVVAEAADGHEAWSMIQKGLQFDVILADLKMQESGMQLISRINQTIPGKKAIVLSEVEEENSVIDAFKAGASGYLLKSVTKDELVFAIRHVMAGNTYLCSELTANMLVKQSERQPVPHCKKLEIGLSKRETEVLGLIAEGLTNNEIANRLFTSRRTVEGHRKNLIDKTGARNTATLIRFAVTNGLLK
jgi:DNA-binding NarL/FixJ family response regulator